MWKFKKLQIAKAILSKKANNRIIIISYFKVVLYRAVVIKQHTTGKKKNKTTATTKKIDTQIHGTEDSGEKCTQLQPPDFDKESKNINGDGGEERESLP